MRLGPLEIGLIVLLVVMLFGARKIPEIMRSFGIGVKEFRSGLRGSETDASDQTTEQEKTEKEPAS